MHVGWSLALFLLYDRAKGPSPQVMTFSFFAFPSFPPSACAILICVVRRRGTTFKVSLPSSPSLFLVCVRKVPPSYFHGSGQCVPNILPCLQFMQGAKDKREYVPQYALLSEVNSKNSFLQYRVQCLSQAHGVLDHHNKRGAVTFFCKGERGGLPNSAGTLCRHEYFCLARERIFAQTPSGKRSGAELANAFQVLQLSLKLFLLLSLYYGATCKTLSSLPQFVETRPGRTTCGAGREEDRKRTQPFFPGASVRPVVLPLLPRLFNAGRDEAHNFPRNETVALKKNQLGVMRGFREGFFFSEGRKTVERQYRRGRSIPSAATCYPPIWNNFHQTYLKRAGLCFSWTLADSFNNST